MKRDRKILYKSVESNLLEARVDFIYIEDSNFFFTHILLDSTQYEIWTNSDSKGEDKILLMGIERGKVLHTENITNHKMFLSFAKEHQFVDLIRDYKLNKIIN